MRVSLPCRRVGERGRDRRRAERPRRRDPARRGRATGDRARGRRPSRRRGPDRGADAPGLPPRHVLVRLSGRRPRRRCSRGCRSSATACAGPIRRPATRTRSPAAGRWRCTATSTGRRRASTPFTRATGDGGARSSRRCSTRSRRSGRRCSAASRRSAERAALLRDLGPLGTARFAALLPGSARGTRAPAVRGRRIAGVAVRLGRPRRRPADGRRQRDRRPSYLNLMGHAVGWPSPAGGAERLTDALVGYLRELGGEVRTGALVESIEAAARPGRRGPGRRRRAGSPPISSSPT